MLLPAQEQRSDYLDTGSDEKALSNAQRASVRDLLLDIPINAEGLIELCNLGWLDPEQLRDRRAAADAVIELTNAALSRRLRPNIVRLKTSKRFIADPARSKSAERITEAETRLPLRCYT